MQTIISPTCFLWRWFSWLRRSSFWGHLYFGGSRCYWFCVRLPSLGYVPQHITLQQSSFRTCCLNEAGIQLVSLKKHSNSWRHWNITTTMFWAAFNWHRVFCFSVGFFETRQTLLIINVILNVVRSSWNKFHLWEGCAHTCVVGRLDTDVNFFIWTSFFGYQWLLSNGQLVTSCKIWS